MEACIENHSKGPMVLEYVRFDAAPPLHAVSIDIRDVLMTDFINDNPLGSYIDQLQVSHCILCLSSFHGITHQCIATVPGSKAQLQHILAIYAELFEL